MEVINAIGRRKAAVARVYVSEGKGNITINKRPLEEYFTLPTLQYIVKQPLELLGVTGQYDIKVNLDGGGFKGQQKPCVWVSPELWVKSMQKTNLN